MARLGLAGLGTALAEGSRGEDGAGEKGDRADDSDGVETGGEGGLGGLDEFGADVTRQLLGCLDR